MPDVSQALRKLERLQARVTNLKLSLPTEMTAAAQQMGEASLRASVYGTPAAPGDVRTGNLLRQFKATRATGGVRIISAATYASQIERIALSRVGMSPNTGRVTGLGGWQANTVAPPYFGRTGTTPNRPGPHVSPAGLRALWLARERLKREIKL